MPVIVRSLAPHPFLPSLGDITAIEVERAQHQDIRPLEIAILNLMADKQSAERQLSYWLGGSAIQVNLTFVCTDSYAKKIEEGYQPHNTSIEHIQTFYRSWSEVKDQKFDGLVVTGVNALQDRVENEKIWPEVEAIFEWSKTNVFSSLFLCWGAKAALKHFHNIDSIKGETKLWGLFDHKLGPDKANLLFGFPDVFPVPVSRWKSPDRAAIEANPNLEILADSIEAGPNILAETELYDHDRHYYAQRVYILNHPEYETQTLGNEYYRDIAKRPELKPPAHYFTDNDPNKGAVNKWRHTGYIYTNWVRLTYQAAPARLEDIPVAHQSRK